MATLVTKGRLVMVLKWSTYRTFEVKLKLPFLAKRNQVHDLVVIHSIIMATIYRKYALLLKFE